ncbi:AAA family ATPase (plasmid) [Pontibacillus sp. ALD_SL1]|uniref:replicative DNA helicase n=1 Tax=Pontibacillus sp. ALD_SL1 TaxID=2777185 RepID=UPI001A96E765|nr:DnaB-like helicase C-terminal domain-containing protein [Pontibacillus sp. ALD_SL1]QST02971.1 AAA family ATPase [Pontibacillus sp. ALD_SL1]
MTMMVTLEKRESLVLSSILFDKECCERASRNGLNLHVFHDPVLRKVASAFNGVTEDGTFPTKTLLLDQLCGSDKEKRHKWSKFFQELKKETPPEPLEALEKHLDVLRDGFSVRQYESIATTVLNKVKSYDPYDPKRTKTDIQHYIENAFFELEEISPTTDKNASLKDGIRLAIQNMKEKLETINNESVSLGYDDLDAALDGGIKKGTFAIAAARPGMGKTIWMLNISIEAAKKGSKVLFVSIEMSLLQCFQRLLSKVSGVSGKRIQQPKEMSREEWSALEKAATSIAETKEDRLWIEERTEITVPQLERLIRHYKKKHNIDAVFVDYAQIMLTKEGNEPSEEKDYSQISGGLRRAAKNQYVAIVVGSQLSRDVEKRQDHRPIMADIRNSGAFEQDAAYVFGLYRDEHYNKETTEKPGILEIIFLKNRFGTNGITLEHRYDLDKQTIYTQSDKMVA